MRYLEQLRRQSSRRFTSQLRLCLSAAFLSAMTSCNVANAGDAISNPAQKAVGVPQETIVPSLAVLNSMGAHFSSGRLTLTGVTSNTIVFAERPGRSVGHVLTSDFIKQWDAGADSFAADPPNATLSVFSPDGRKVEDTVIVLAKPMLIGADLSFDITVLDGGLHGASGPASLFIDWYHPRGAHGPRPAWHGGWYKHRHHGSFGAGLAAGALSGVLAGTAIGGYPLYAHSPRYIAPPCGYYPYPLCY